MAFSLRSVEAMRLTASSLVAPEDDSSPAESWPMADSVGGGVALAVVLGFAAAPGCPAVAGVEAASAGIGVDGEGFVLRRFTGSAGLVSATGGGGGAGSTAAGSDGGGTGLGSAPGGGLSTAAGALGACACGGGVAEFFLCHGMTHPESARIAHDNATN